MPRNITNTFENVNNRTITNSILTNSLQATLPLELTDDGTDNIISIKGLTALGTSNQFLRMKSDASGLEFITLTFVDLDSTQTVNNKTFKNCSLNHNSNQTTNIGSNSSQTNINGFLNLNSGNDRAVISYNADDNHSIFLRKDISGVDNRISFYEWDAIKFYTGARSTNASAMPLRFSINEVGCEASGNLTVVGEITGNTVSVKELFLYEQADNGSNYINIKPPADMSSNFTVNVKAESGTLALITDLPTVPTITATAPMAISNNVISIGGLTNFGSSGQVLTSTGSGFSYTTLNNLTNSDVLLLVQNADDFSTYAGNAFGVNDSTRIGDTSTSANSRNTIISGRDITLNSTNTNTKLQIAGNDIMILSDSILHSKTKLLLSSSNTSLDAISADFELHKNLSSDTIFLIHNSYTSNNAVAKLLFKSVSNLCAFEFTKTSEKFTTSGMKIFDFKIWNGSSNNTKLLLNDSINISKNVLLVSSSATTRDDSNTNFEVNNGSAFTKMLLKTTATNQDVELAFKNGNSQGNLKMLNGDNSLEFNSFSGYTFKTSSNDRFIINTTNISRSGLLVSGNSTGLETNANFQVDSSGATKAIIKTSSTSNDIELAFKNGNTQGQIKMLGSTNSLDFGGFSAYTFGSYTKINYNDANSFLALASNVSNAKIGIQFYQSSTSGKLYLDFSNGNLVFESSNTSNQRIEIQGSNPSVVDSNDKNLIGKDGNGVLCGNTTMNLQLKTSSYIEASGAIDMTRNPIRFRDQGDDNHRIVYERIDSVFGDGLRINGYTGLLFSTQQHGTHFVCFEDSGNSRCGGPFAYVITSDDRLKFNETPLTNCLETIKKLNPVSYRKTTEIGEPDNPNLPIEYGLVAQEVYNNVPELRHAVIFDKTLPRNFVDGNLDGDCVEDIYKKATGSDGITTIEPHICSVSYQDINVVSIKAIQELYKLVQDLQNEIIELKSNK